MKIIRKIFHSVGKQTNKSPKATHADFLRQETSMSYCRKGKRVCVSEERRLSGSHMRWVRAGPGHIGLLTFC